ncbi:MAG TPA: hypothetical protein PKE16_01885, partial [Hyphomicrobium sp.]|nr:hypothetical protein [Hyphomicrobium sp.]
MPIFKLIAGIARTARLMVGVPD